MPALKQLLFLIFQRHPCRQQASQNFPVNVSQVLKLLFGMMARCCCLLRLITPSDFSVRVDSSQPDDRIITLIPDASDIPFMLHVHFVRFVVLVSVHRRFCFSAKIYEVISCHLAQRSSTSPSLSAHTTTCTVQHSMREPYLNDRRCMTLFR
jgi:hypothetical protein